MGYSLYLRRRADAEPVTRDAIELALTGVGGVLREGAYQIPAEGRQLVAKVAGPADQPEGADLEIPYGCPESDYRAALLVAAAAAAKAQMALLDPQLGVELGPGNAEDSVRRWRESNRYALDTAGLAEDPRRDLPIEAPAPTVKLWVKVLGVGIGLLIVASFVTNWLIAALASAPKPID